MLASLKYLAHGKRAAVPGALAADFHRDTASESLDRAEVVAGCRQVISVGEEIHPRTRRRRRGPGHRLPPPSAQRSTNRPQNDAEDDQRREPQPQPERDVQVKIANPEPVQEATEGIADRLDDPHP